MKNLLLILIAFFLTSQSILADDLNPKDPININSYKLAPGDLLEISVWKEEDLHKQVVIAPDGSISLPLVDTMIAAGKTTTELKQLISDKLVSYMADPAVNVSLIKNDGNTIFVIGKVNRPGQFMTNRYIDVLQAISLAGGLTVFAKESSIHVLRRTGNTIKVFDFDYDDVLDGENLNQNIILEPGDTVTVR
ncbi:MAG: polysaccharide biosynthesis/export family protein [Methylococcales bacterium]